MAAEEGNAKIDGEARRMARDAHAMAEVAAREAALALAGLHGHEAHCAERYTGLTGSIDKLHGRITKASDEAGERDRGREQEQRQRDNKVMWTLIGGLGSVVLLLAVQLLAGYSDRLRILEALGR